MMVASTGAYRRSVSLAAAAVASLALLLAGAPRAAALNVGGAGSPSTSPSATGVGVAPSSSATSLASLHVRNVRITGVSCVPTVHCSGNPHQVSTHGTLLLSGPGLRSGMTVLFPASSGARISVNRPSPAGHIRLSRIGLVVTVPKNAHSGRIMVLVGHGRYTSAWGPISIYTHALHPPAKPLLPPPPPRGAAVSTSAVSGTAFDGQGMWIWYLSQSNGGSIPAIVAQAHAAGVTTVFVKSSDGSSNYWSQFSSQLVQELHANGLKVCGWQYVYGTNPKGEAALGAEAAANGADCLVIDAESEYEGRYAAAQSYINELRAKVGPAFPVALASFPYVSYHSSEPYSVFLGPGGAQYNAPQMYWKDIGVSVDTIYANTYIANRIYQRPIFPLGQTYGGVSSSDLLRFREEAVDYGATGLSFWDWQETHSSGWSTLAAPLAPLTSVVANTSYPELSKGSKGDQVLWMQEHLAGAVPKQEVTGNFGSQTLANLTAFQSAHAIAPSGVTDAATWVALLAVAPVAVNWTGGGPSG
jgi:peptidoglycan hydrolase-like protein with peptidoglycan-binding domain